MGRQILTTEIPRKPGMLYYCSTDKKGNLALCEAPMVHGRKKKKAKPKTTAKKPAKKKPVKKSKR